MTRRAWVSLFALFVSSCAATTPMALTDEGARVRVSDERAVEGCELVGHFVGGVGARPVPALWGANQVRNLAAKSGATDVVFDQDTRNQPSGNGYRCNRWRRL